MRLLIPIRRGGGPASSTNAGSPSPLITRASRTGSREASGLTAFQQSLVPNRLYVKGSLKPSAGIGHAPTVRILSWNIERGYQPERIAAAIAALRPDVVCLQEVDWGNERTGSRDVLDALAGRLQMLGLFAVEFLELASLRRSARIAGGGATGNAILTRFPVKASFRVELPATVDWENGACDPEVRPSLRRRLRREPRLGTRCGIGAVLMVGSMRLAVCSLHLEDKDGGIADRWSQFRQAVATLEACGGDAHAMVVAGDLNTFDSPLSRFVRPQDGSASLGKPFRVCEAEWWKSVLLPQCGYHDPFDVNDCTFAVPPVYRAKLDWIAAKGGRISDCGVGTSTLSDHLPIWADLVLGAG